jgi:hypothetical protein
MGLTSIGASANVKDVSFRQSIKMVFRPSKCSAMPNHVAAVFFMGLPAKILVVVVRAASVLVRNFVFWGWRRAMKSPTHQSVDIDVSLPIAGTVKDDGMIPGLFLDSPLKQLTDVPLLSDGAVLVPGIARSRTPHATVAADLVVRPIRHNSPFLGVEIERKLGSIHRRVSSRWWSGGALPGATGARSRYFSAGWALNEERTFA